MAGESVAWAHLVHHWGEIAALLESEIPEAFSANGRGTAPQTYKLMRSLIESC